MSKLKTIGLFIGGALFGGAVTGYVIRNKYEQILEEEIQSVKDTYKNRTGIDEDFIARKEYRESDLMENCEIDNVATSDDIKEYNSNRSKGVVTDYTKYHKKTTGKLTEVDGEVTNIELVIDEEITIEDPCMPPTLIDEEDAGMHGFDMKTLTYYNDQTLVDDDDNILDIETYVGIENIKIFDENPGCHTMYVRNEHTGIDYEIQRDDMNWSDMTDYHS